MPLSDTPMKPLGVLWSLAALAACGSSHGASTTDAGSDAMSTSESGISEAGRDGAPLSDAASDAGPGGPEAAPGDGSGDGPPCPTSVPTNVEDPAIAHCTTIVYIAGGDDNTVTISTDGTTWQSFEIDHIMGDDYINFISIEQGVVTTTSLPGVYQSVDGAKTFSVVSAIPHTGFDTYGGQINYGDKGLLITDNQGTYLAADEITWVPLTPFAGDASGDGFGGHYHGVAFGNGHYVAFQDSGRFREYDGTAFVDGTTSVLVASVAFGNGVFVGVGGGGVVTSNDALTWATQPGFDGGAQPDVILFNGTQFLAYAYGGTTAYTTTDGTSWGTSALPNSVRVDTAAYYDGHYFGVGSVGSTTALLLSNDGLSWSLAQATTASETFNINGPRVGIGRILR
jgi:hypothetical protein